MAILRATWDSVVLLLTATTSIRGFMASSTTDSVNWKTRRIRARSTGRSASSPSPPLSPTWEASSSRRISSRVAAGRVWPGPAPKRVASFSKSTRAGAKTQLRPFRGQTTSGASRSAWCW